MMGAPELVWGTYQTISEPVLRQAADKRLREIIPSAYNWTPDLADMASAVVALGAEIRALDRALFEVREQGREGSAQAYKPFGGASVYILPRLDDSIRPGRKGQAFERRGLVHHRILPQAVDGVDIILHVPSIRGPGDDGSAADLASGVFAQVDLDIVTDADAFHVRGIDNEDAQLAALDAQMDELGAGAPCLAAVWPELTISPRLLDHMASRLRVRGLQDSAPPLGLLVAGSWHEVGAGGRVNRTAILNESGQTLFEVVKRHRFELTAGVLEDIAPGNAVPVLLYGDLLIAFGICKDFCERRRRRIYEALDVDLVIVPSMGRQNTMDEHEVAVGDLSVRYGARVFVVQQIPMPPNPGADSDVWGLVLRPPAKPFGVAGKPKTQTKTLDRSTISCTIS